MLKQTYRPCPICGESEAEVLHTQRFLLPEGALLPDIYDVVSCTFCGFVYADTTASQQDYDHYYTEFSKYEDPKLSSGGSNNIWDIEKFVMTADELSNYVHNDSSILDIGCANGGLLEILKQRGFSQLTGLDPSLACVSYIKNVHGIRAIQGGIFSRIKDGEFAEEKFDLVILSHVLEHICDLQLAIEMIVNKLKDGAYLYIEVPNAAQYWNFPVVPFYYFDCEHINHLDINSLKNLIEPRGFKFISGKPKVFLASEWAQYPAVATVFQKNPSNTESAHIVYNDVTKFSVIKHIKHSKLIQEGQNNQLIFNNTEKVVIWGAGSYTLRLLGNSPLGECNLVAFVDNDPKKQGMKFAGKMVYGPQFLEGNNYTVLVCSALFSDEIVKQIKEIGIDRKIIIPLSGGENVGNI